MHWPDTHVKEPTWANSNQRVLCLDLVFLKYQNEVSNIEYAESIEKSNSSLISCGFNHATQRPAIEIQLNVRKSVFNQIPVYKAKAWQSSLSSVDQTVEQKRQKMHVSGHSFDYQRLIIKCINVDETIARE